IGGLRRSLPADLVLLFRHEELDSGARRSRSHDWMKLCQILLTPQVGVNVVSGKTDVLEHAAVEARKLARRAAADRGFGHTLAQPREETRLLAFRQADSLRSEEHTSELQSRE